MTPGYYRAKHKQRGWIVVEVVPGLHGAVFWRGNSVQRSEFSRIDEQPLMLEDDAEIDRLRAEVGRLAALVSIHFPEAVMPPEVKREAPATPQP